MAEQRVECPNCGHKFAVTKALTDQIEDSLRKEYEREATALEKDLKASFSERLEVQLEKADVKARKEARTAAAIDIKELKKQLADAEKAEKAHKENFNKQLKIEAEQIMRKATEDAEGAFSDELKELKSQVRKRNNEIKGLQEAAAELEEREAALVKKENSLRAQIKRETEKARKETEEELAEEYKDQELQHAKIIADLRKQLTDTKRKLDQRSQQLQGEVSELDFEELLSAAFPDDEIEPVKKGKSGADIVQRVFSPNGSHCGTIIWEIKNTKNWAKTWIKKVKADQRRIKAELAVIVSKALPNDVKGGFGNVDGVWVCDHPVVQGVATALRVNLIELARHKQNADGKNGKMEVLYQYLMSTEFNQRVEAIVEAFEDMKDDLEKERATMERLWAKRDKQLQQVVGNIYGMVGEIQAITPAFPKIRRLELPSPE